MPTRLHFMHNHELPVSERSNAAAAFTVRRHLAVIFMKLRHPQSLAPLSLSLSLSFFLYLSYRTVGVSQPNPCGTFELDSESGKSDYREDKLDSDVKRIKTPTRQRRMCYCRAPTVSSSW